MTALYVPIQQCIAPKIPWKTRPPYISYSQKTGSLADLQTRERHSLGRRSLRALSAYNTFSAVNREVLSFGVRSQCNYESSLIGRSQDNPKLLHSYIRNKKIGRPTVGPLQMRPGQLTDDAASMAELFAMSLLPLFTQLPPHLTLTLSPTSSSMELSVKLISHVNVSILLSGILTPTLLWDQIIYTHVC